MQPLDKDSRQDSKEKTGQPDVYPRGPRVTHIHLGHPIVVADQMVHNGDYTPPPGVDMRHAITGVVVTFDNRTRFIPYGQGCIVGAELETPAKPQPQEAEQLPVKRKPGRPRKNHG